MRPAHIASKCRCCAMKKEAFTACAHTRENLNLPDPRGTADRRWSKATENYQQILYWSKKKNQRVTCKQIHNLGNMFTLQKCRLHTTDIGSAIKRHTVNTSGSALCGASTELGAGVRGATRLSLSVSLKLQSHRHLHCLTTCSSNSSHFSAAVA